MRSLRSSLGAAVLVLAAPAVLWAAPAGASGACGNESIREQQGSTYLPECRAFELVSPQAKKNGQEVEVPEQYVKESPAVPSSGERSIYYTLTGAPEESLSGGLWVAALSSTELPASPWALTAIAPENRFATLPGTGPRTGGEYVYWDPNLTCGVLRTRLPQAESPESSEPMLAEGESEAEWAEQLPFELYVWNRGTKTKQLVTSKAPVNARLAGETDGYYVSGASANCGKVVYENQAAGYNLAGAPSRSQYEWTAETGPRIASILPDGKPAKEVEAVEQGNQHMSSLGIVSADGSKVFFTAESEGGNEELTEGTSTPAREVYMRLEDRVTKQLSTKEISKSTTSTPDKGAVFQGASPDGGKAFFLANYGLTPAPHMSVGSQAAKSCATDGSKTIPAGTGCDLYSYDTASGELTDLSADVESVTGDTKGANVRGVLGWSADGSYVYFSASGQLVKGQGKSEAENEAAKEASVYAYHEDHNHEGHITYVTNIGEVEAGGGANHPEPLSQLDAVLSNSGFGSHYVQSRVSSNGQYLLFATAKEPTGYNNVDRGASPERHDTEFFEYRYSEAPTSSANLSCVTCEPSGQKPLEAGATFGPKGPFVYNYNGVLTRTLLDEGQVVFQSSDPLVPQAERPGGLLTVDVYEYRPVGVGGCGEPTLKASGCINILDSGADPFPTYLSGASANGNDVYLTTHARLARQDQDGLRDMYDVRVEGGVFEESPKGNCQELQEADPEHNPGCQGAYESGFGAASHKSEAKIGNGNLPPNQPIVEVEPFREYKLRLGRHSSRGSKLTLVVVAPVGGTISISGSGIGGARKSVSVAGSYTFKLTLGAKGRRALQHHKRFSVRLRVSFAPKSGKAAPVSLTVTFR